MPSTIALTGPSRRWTADDIPSLAGRTFVVTGASGGLGYETAHQLATHGAHVVMTARSEERGRRALEALRRAQPHASLELRRLDVSDLDSVAAFAGGVVADQVPVDVLVNNAGVLVTRRSLTRQGFELQFATNHLGHFALTGLLLETLKRGRDPRVVTVSSDRYRHGVIRFDDLTGVRGYSGIAFYDQSKLANMLFGLELERRLQAAGAPVKSIVANPGRTATRLQSSGPTGPLRLVLTVQNRFIAKDVAIGALDQLYAATDPNARGGQFVGPAEHGDTRGYPTIVQPVEAARDPETARRLWRVSEELTVVPYGLPV